MKAFKYLAIATTICFAGVYANEDEMQDESFAIEASMELDDSDFVAYGSDNASDKSMNQRTAVNNRKLKEKKEISSADRGNPEKRRMASPEDSNGTGSPVPEVSRY